jgi:hypothetical protein
MMDDELASVGLSIVGRMERARLVKTSSTTSLRQPSWAGDGVIESHVALSLQRSTGNAGMARQWRSGGSLSPVVQRQSVTMASRGPVIMAGEGTTPELLAERD